MGRPKAKAATTDYTPSTLPSDHRLVILGIPQGSNNFLCSDPEGVERLVELGAKLRRSVLATRGDFAIVQLYPPSPETSGKGKTSRLAGEVVSMVSPGEVKRWKKDGEWPEGFGETPRPSRVEPPRTSRGSEENESESESGSLAEDDLPPNPNRRVVRAPSEDEEEDEDEDEEEDEEDE